MRHTQTLEHIVSVLESIRAPIATDEYDLHHLVCQTLAQAGIGCVHEAQLAPRCRIDVLCERIGIEIKRGRPTASVLLRQLTRYAQSGALDALIVLSERRVTLPEKIAGIPVKALCLFQLWGLADTGESLGNPSDHMLAKATLAMSMARDALGMPAAPAPADYSDADVPAYLQDVSPDAHCYGTLSYNRRRKCWVVRGEPSVVEMCKRLFPGSDAGTRGEARFSDHQRIVGDLNWLMMRYPLEIAQRDRERWQSAVTQARDYAAARRRALDMPQQAEPLPGTFLGTLKPFQKAGLAWLCATPRALLADEMGLGKTLQALCCLCNTRAFPAIVIVPPHLVRNWQAEIQRFIRIDGRAPSVHVLHGLTPYALPQADIYIVHYLLLRGWKDVLPNLSFRAVIFDEVQELRRTGSEKYSAASLLSQACQRVIGLSGTPIYNHGGEIWNVVNILDYHFLGIGRRLRANGAMAMAITL